MGRRKSFLRKKVTVSVTKTPQASPFRPGRRSEIVFREREIELGTETRKYPQVLGYGALHTELMREMKEKLKERYVK